MQLAKRLNGCLHLAGQLINQLNPLSQGIHLLMLLALTN